MKRLLALFAVLALPFAGASVAANAQTDQFEIVAKHSGKCLSPAVGATGNGVAVIQVACDRTVNQRWYTEQINANTHLIRNVASKRCVDVYGWVNADSVATIMWDCHRGTNQQFELRPRDGGYNEFRAVFTSNSRCVDIAHDKAHDGAPAYLWGCHGHNNQQFKLNRLP